MCDVVLWCKMQWMCAASVWVSETFCMALRCSGNSMLAHINVALLLFNSRRSGTSHVIVLPRIPFQPTRSCGRVTPRCDVAIRCEWTCTPHLSRFQRQRILRRTFYLEEVWYRLWTLDCQIISSRSSRKNHLLCNYSFFWRDNQKARDGAWLRCPILRWWWCPKIYWLSCYAAPRSAWPIRWIDVWDDG